MIALSVVKDQSFLVQTSTLVLIAALITVGVYGLVAGIVKLDDIGYWLLKKNKVKSIQHKLGSLLINAAPYLMKFLSFVGTLAMFLVGGGIIQHNISLLHKMELSVSTWIGHTPAVGELLSAATPTLLGFVTGFIVGCFTLGVVKLVQMLMGQKSEVAH